MLYKFIYKDNISTFETNTDNIGDAIINLKKLAGKFYNPNNIIFDIRYWRIYSSLVLDVNDSISIKDKFGGKH